MNKILSLLLIVYTFNTIAQSTHPISANVKDKFTQNPLGNCTVNLQPLNLNTNTDSLGKFYFKDIKPGRYYIIVSHIGYSPQSTEYFIHSNNITQLNIELTENIKILNEVEIKAKASLGSNDAQNEFSYLSSRSFTAEETERIPMGLNDPARMAQSFAGVQGGRNDLENQIIVRGNSPYGISWRIEGIDIPNPNHFTKHGSAGGGVSVFSAQVIGKSDFYSGAMPAEFGNALAASFDIRLRQGNLQNTKHKARMSMLGIDLATEGPIKKGRSSYLINYRYSTLGLLNWLAFYLINNRAVNTFSDLSFNLAFNSRNGKNITTIFGVGGKSLDRSFPEPNVTKRKPGETDDWEDRVRPSDIGVVGLTHTRNINSSSSIKFVLAASGSNILRTSDTLSADDTRFRYNNETYLDKRISTSIAFNKNLGNGFKLKTGVQMQFINFKFNRETYPRRALFDLNAFQNGKLIWADGKGSTQTGEIYALLQKTFNEKLHLNTGLHYIHFFFNNTKSLEPRIALKFSPNIKNIFALSYGIHSQLLPLSTYFVAKQDRLNDQVSYTYPNKNLDFPLSQHIVASYKLLLKKDLKITTEIYYQYIYRSLVQKSDSSNFWILNSADGYPGITDLSATGIGFNKGIDISIEKLFFYKYFFLLTGSVFDAKYKSYNGSIFNSSFNDRFGAVATFGREFSLKKSRIIQTGFRVIFNGGFRYTTPDLVLSALYKSYYPKFSETNELTAPDYKRIDARVAYRFNGKKTSGQFSLDVQNVTGYINYSRAFYNPLTKRIDLQRKGTGFTPIASLSVEF